jgi:hypothetical protein
MEVLFVNGCERSAGGAAGLSGSPGNHGPPPGALVVDEADGRPRKALICYSLGNFTSTMATPLCRLALVASLTIDRDPRSGHVSWSGPETGLLANLGPLVRRGRRGERRLVPVSVPADEASRRRLAAPGHPLPPNIARAASQVRRHIWG